MDFQSDKICIKQIKSNLKTQNSITVWLPQPRQPDKIFYKVKKSKDINNNWWSFPTNNQCNQGNQAAHYRGNKFVVIFIIFNNLVDLQNIWLGGLGRSSHTVNLLLNISMIKLMIFTKLSHQTAHHHNLPLTLFNHVWENCFGQRDGTNNV